jgi:hypothetical protein
MVQEMVQQEAARSTRAQMAWPTKMKLMLTVAEEAANLVLPHLRVWLTPIAEVLLAASLSVESRSCMSTVRTP